MYNPFTLKDKTILVTGASSGIGKAIAIECSKMGATLIITGRDKTKLDDTFEKLNGQGHTEITSDLRSSEGIEKVVSQVNHLNGIVNCAGIAKFLPFQFITDASISETMSINFIAPALLTKEIIKRKLINKGGSIVFISSISGIICSSIGATLYSASKGAISGLVKGLALDLAHRGIRVNSVSPGMIETNIFLDETLTPDQIETDKSKYPLGRYGKPEEVAHSVIFLLSDASSWMTGSNLLIDGGYTLN